MFELYKMMMEYGAMLNIIPDYDTNTMIFIFNDGTYTHSCQISEFTDFDVKNEKDFARYLLIELREWLISCYGFTSYVPPGTW